MAKAAASLFACSNCGYSSGRWFGRCPGCGEFGTLVEESKPAERGASGSAACPLLRLVDVEADEAERIPTGVPELGRVLGSVAQVREAAARLLRVAKENGVAVFLVGHVTKDGTVAGPRVLEHLVDCVLQFEGDRYRAHRILRAVKNRFGSTNELGGFEMTDRKSVV